MAVKYNTVILLIVAAMVEGLTATIYYVGDSFGWQDPMGGYSYSNWANQHSFRAGDILVFNFFTGQHTAAQVTQNDYNSCNTANPIMLQTVAPANYTLNNGPSYFICTLDGHCSQGQKLAINAGNSAGSPPGFPAPPYAGSPPGFPAPPYTPAPPGFYTPPGYYNPPGYFISPPPPSSATPTAIAAASSLIFIPIFLAFVC